jgi:hypothetical protein
MALIYPARDENARGDGASKFLRRRTTGSHAPGYQAGRNALRATLAFAERGRIMRAFPASQVLLSDVTSRRRIDRIG